jgi:hypothetical protein
MIRPWVRSSWIVLALVPALAVAAPRGKRKVAKKKKARATQPAPPSEPVDPPAAPDADADATQPAQPPAPTVNATPEPAAPPTSTPTPAAAPDEPADAAADDADVDTLRQEYLSLRDELFKSRARASTVASQLYSTRIQIKLTYTTARFYNPAKASIRLDGASVYENASGAIAGDDGVRFDGYVAPGRHLITFRVEATGKDDDSFTSVTESQIVVKAVAGKDLLVSAKAKDGGDIAYEWKRSEKGSYGLGIDVAVKTTARADAGGGKK